MKEEKQQNYKVPMIVPNQNLVFSSYQHWIENGIELKECPACGEAKPLSEYTKNKNAKDGLHWRCRDCKNEIWREGYARRKLKSSRGLLANDR